MFSNSLKEALTFALFSKKILIWPKRSDQEIEQHVNDRATPLHVLADITLSTACPEHFQKSALLRLFYRYLQHSGDWLYILQSSLKRIEDQVDNTSFQRLKVELTQLLKAAMDEKRRRRIGQGDDISSNLAKKEINPKVVGSCTPR